MTVTRYEDLQQWFNSNQSNNEEGKTPSHWTLYGGNYGEKEVRLCSNTRLDAPAESLAYLVDTIRRMNHPNGAKFRVQIFKPGSPNNYIAQVYVQVFEGAANTATPQTAGIGNLPGASTEQYIQERIDLALLKRENEDLKAQINGPVSGFERFLDIIGQNEQLSGAIAGLLLGFANKNGIPAAIPAPVNGHPSTDDDDNDPQTVFAQNIQNASDALHTDPVSLAKALNKLVTSNPDLAKQIFSQA